MRRSPAALADAAIALSADVGVDRTCGCPSPSKYTTVPRGLDAEETCCVSTYPATLTVLVTSAMRGLLGQ